jgi:DNA-binding NarL/FixJ family response regulator
MAQSVAVLEKNPQVAQYLAGGLRSHFKVVYLIQSREELWEEMSRDHPDALVVDVEDMRLSEVETLHHNFPGLAIVCTHRIPDEELWMAALEAGASDVCPTDDVNSVLTSVLRSVKLAHAAA